MENQKKNDKSFWPYGIILAITFIILSSITTVIIAVNSPHDMDSTYLQSYQNVDENINEILEKQAKFDENFVVDVKKDNFIIGKNYFDLIIKDKNGKGIDGAKIILHLTRPDVSSLDQDLKAEMKGNGIYHFSNFELKNLGRWQIESKITINGYEGFYKTEINATK